MYGKMSPFFHADRIKEPLLLIHGAADNNPGTFPVQSERLYQAVRGNGGKGGNTLVPILNPGRGNNPGNPGNPGNPIHPIFPPGGGHWVHWHHHHWIWRDGIWVDLGLDDVADAPADEAPGPCNCLTKTYTQDGLVVFADICTKEAASARVDGAAADATPVPPVPGKSSDATPVAPADPTDVSKAPTSQNFAGRTFQDFLAANQQAAKN